MIKILLILVCVGLSAQESTKENFSMDLFADKTEVPAENSDEDDDFSIDLFADKVEAPAENGDEEDELTIDLFADSEDDSEKDLFEKSEDETTEVSIFGADTESDLFKALDSDIVEKRPNLVEAFIDNINGTTSFRYHWYFFLLEVEENASPEPDNKRHLFETHSEFESYTGGKQWRFNIEATTDFGNQTNTYVPGFEDLEARNWQDWFQDTKRERRFLLLNQYYVSFFLNDVDIFLGRRTFENTLSTIYSPADIYTPSDANSPFNPVDIGRYVFELGYYFGDSSITAAVLPIYQGGKSFSPLSRWGYYKFKEQQDEEDVSVEDQEDSEDEERHYTEITWENISYLLKFKSTFSGLDIFITGFYGLANNTVSMVTINDQDEEEKEFVVIPVINASGGFSATIQKLELHGEALYNYSIDSKDDDYLRYMLGGRYIIDGFSQRAPLDRIDITVEYGGEWLIHEQSHADYQDSTNDRRGMKNSLLTSLQVQFTEDILCNIFAQYDFDQYAGTLIGNVNYKGFENFDLELAGQYFLAPENSDYYYWRHNHRLMASVTYSY
jgi:hypothetical protein